MSTYDISFSVSEGSRGTPIEDAFCDAAGNPGDGLEAIFPIFEYAETNAWTPIGTGFFIARDGLFVTARHVLVDHSTGAPHSSLVAAQIIRREKRVVLRRVLNITLHPTADVAIGFLSDEHRRNCGSQVPNKIFALSKRDPSVGDDVASMAFPNSTFRGSADEFSMVFTSIGMAGKVLEVHPDGRDRTFLPSKCFRTDMHISGGASGGPVGFGGGEIFGINSTGFDGHPDINYISSISDILSLTTLPLQLPDGTIRSAVRLSALVDHKIIVVR